MVAAVLGYGCQDMKRSQHPLRNPNRCWQALAGCTTVGAYLLGAAHGAAWASGVAIAKATGSGSRHLVTASHDRFSLARLAGLRNYAFTYNASGAAKAVGRVHSPTDWQLAVTGGPTEVTTYDVNGQGYALVTGFTQVERLLFKTPEGFTHLNGERTWAQAFIGATHVTGMRITSAGPCRVAGERGTAYDFKTALAARKIFSLADTACVSRTSGALLSFAEGVTGGSAAGAVGLDGKSQAFTVTALGGVGTIRAPKAPTTKTAPRSAAPAGTRPSAGLPAGFPSQVPAPPGKITSSARLSASKWYLLLSEAHANAITGYTTTLLARGFSLTNRTNDAAGDIVTLGDASFQVVIEEMSLPGQGDIMAVTVGRT